MKQLLAKLVAWLVSLLPRKDLLLGLQIGFAQGGHVKLFGNPKPKHFQRPSLALFQGQAQQQVYSMVVVGCANWKGWPTATLTQRWQQKGGNGCSTWCFASTQGEIQRWGILDSSDWELKMSHLMEAFRLNDGGRKYKPVRLCNWKNCRTTVQSS